MHAAAQPAETRGARQRPAGGWLVLGAGTDRDRLELPAGGRGRCADRGDLTVPDVDPPEGGMSNSEGDAGATPGPGHTPLPTATAEASGAPPGATDTGGGAPDMLFSARSPSLGSWRWA